MTESARRTAGFTLIEVLVALVILAIAAGFAFNTASDSFAQLSQADMEEQAVTVAETTLARLGHDVSVQPGHSAGEQRKLRWRVEIGTALTEPAPADGLAAYPVTILVEWQANTASRQFQLHSVVLGPEAKPL